MQPLDTAWPIEAAPPLPCAPVEHVIAMRTTVPVAARPDKRGKLPRHAVRATSKPPPAFNVLSWRRAHRRAFGT